MHARKLPIPCLWVIVRFIGFIFMYHVEVRRSVLRGGCGGEERTPRGACAGGGARVSGTARPVSSPGQWRNNAAALFGGNKFKLLPSRVSRNETEVRRRVSRSPRPHAPVRFVKRRLSGVTPVRVSGGGWRGREPVRFRSAETAIVYTGCFQ